MHKRSPILVFGILIAAASQVTAQDRRDRVTVRDRPAIERAQRPDGREEQTERTTRTFKIGANGEVSLSNVSGSISIARGRGNDAVLEIVKTARGRTVEEAREALALVEIDIAERGSRVEVKTRYSQGDEPRRNRRNLNVAVDYNLTTPQGTRVSATSISGDITSKDITGDVALESVSGAVRIANGGRVAAAKSISGAVEITDTEIEGRLAASSVSGTVVLRNVKARGVEAAAVSGDVQMQEVAADRVEAQTVSGSVEFSGPLARGGRYELTSHSGSVNVAVSGNTGFELEATSFSGSVRSDIALKSQTSDTGRRHQRSLRGVYGDGSAVLDLTSFSGSIVVSRR